MTRVYLGIALLVALVASHGYTYVWGRGDGRALEAAEAAEAVRDLNNRLEEAETSARKREQLRLAQMADLEQLVEQLRSEIDADPDASQPAIGPDSVRRLNSVR